MIKALLLMGGSGARFGSSTPKQFHNLSGKRVYLHTLERFLHSKLFDEILLVAHPDWIAPIQDDLKHYANQPVRIVPGGTTRQESSRLGLQACGHTTQIVVIHDAVRPFVSQRILRENIESAATYGAADTCIPSADTIVHTFDQHKIATIPNRSELLRGQTPQSFTYPLILHAHRTTTHTASTDDCTLVLEQGHPVHIVEGDERNIKITTELDLTLAEQLLIREPSPPLTPTCSLVGQPIAITGGTGGIGAAIAAALKEVGARPLTIARNRADYTADLTSFTQVERIFKEIYLDHGPLFGLINCIGLLQVKELLHTQPAEISQLLNTNLCSTIASCQAARLKPQGHIVNFASSSYSRGRAHYCVYSATKAAVVNFTQGLAEERPDLHINAIAPQRTDTPMRRTHFPSENPTTLLSPKKIAHDTLALLQSTGITGAVIEIKHTPAYLFTSCS